MFSMTKGGDDMVKKTEGKKRVTTRVARPTGVAKGYAAWILNAELALLPHVL
jgi:hypothetical protein